MKDVLAGLPAIGSEPTDSSPETLALYNMREAFYYAQHCCHGKLTDDEIYSSVYGALCHAARNFKPGGGLRFFGYAKPYIRGGLSKVWRSKDVVRNKKGDFSYSCESIQFDEPAQLAEELGGSEPPEGEGGITETIVLQKRALKIPPPKTEFEIESVQLREEYSLLQPMLLSLTDKEQSVIALRYKSNLTFEKIGSLLGSSRADIQTTHARALKKLRCLLGQKLSTVN